MGTWGWMGVDVDRWEQEGMNGDEWGQMGTYGVKEECMEAYEDV